MKEMKFATELKCEITKKQYISLGTLYNPIIGCQATSLYSLLLDFHEATINNKQYIKAKEYINTLGINSQDFLIAKKKLEAVGLIRSFEAADNKRHIIVINPPLTPQQFKNNNTLYKQVIAKIGEVAFERIFFSTLDDKIKKDDFKETTTKYFEIFEETKSVENTLEMPLIKFDSINEAKAGLNSTQFIKYLTDRRASPSQLAMTQRISSLGLSSPSLNEIINYSFEINAKIVVNHIETIAKDMIEKGFVSPGQIKREMQEAKNKNKEILQTSEFLNYENDDESNETWNDLFSSLGGEL